VEFLCTINITSEDKLSNKNFIMTLEDLNKIVIDNKSNNKVILRKDFINKYFPYNQVQEFKNNVSKINPNLILETENYTISTEVNNEIVNLIKDNMNKDDLTMLLQFKSYEFIETIYKLIERYDENKNFELEGASIISSLRETVDQLNNELNIIKDNLDKEIKNKLDLQNKLSVLINRINYTHNIGINEDMLFNYDNNSYDKVIYIKEITRVQYVDTLILILQEILRLIYGMPTRLLIIEGYYSNGKTALYPNLKPHYKLTEKDVLSGDILMVGYQPKLFKDIMNNPSNISIIIILDRGGYSIPHLIGDNVEYLFTVSDLSDLKYLETHVPLSRIISYKEDTLYIPHIKDFNKLSINQQVQKYSSLKIMKQIISLIEGRKE
jgi:hypothetical protein